MNPPDATVTTRTAIDVDAGDDDRDGVIPEPGRVFSNVLWALLIFTLCIAELVLVGTLALLAFTPDTPKAAVDAATIVAVQGGVLGAVVGFFLGRQAGRR